MTAPDLTPRRLSSDLTVHPLGAGCWAIGGPTVNEGSPVGWSTADNGRSLEGLRRAVAHGANLFDTADVYGHGDSERLAFSNSSCASSRARNSPSAARSDGYAERRPTPTRARSCTTSSSKRSTISVPSTSTCTSCTPSTSEMTTATWVTARAGNERGDPRGHGARGRVDAVPVAQRSQITVPRAGRENQASRGA